MVYSQLFVTEENDDQTNNNSFRLPQNDQFPSFASNFQQLNGAVSGLGGLGATVGGFGTGLGETAPGLSSGLDGTTGTTGFGGLSSNVATAPTGSVFGVNGLNAAAMMGNPLAGSLTNTPGLDGLATTTNNGAMLNNALNNATSNLGFAGAGNLGGLIGTQPSLPPVAAPSPTQQLLLLLAQQKAVLEQQLNISQPLPPPIPQQQQQQQLMMPNTNNISSARGLHRAENILAAVMANNSQRLSPEETIGNNTIMTNNFMTASNNLGLGGLFPGSTNNIDPLMLQQGTNNALPLAALAMQTNQFPSSGTTLNQSLLETAQQACIRKGPSSPIIKERREVPSSFKSLKLSPLEQLEQESAYQALKSATVAAAVAVTAKDKDAAATATAASLPKPRKARNFPVRLMEALEENPNEDAVAWLPDGKSFVIVRPELFCDVVLKKAFKECKYASFVRKLHRWSFVRLTSGTGTDCFHHPLFQRNRMDLANQIVCTPRDRLSKGFDFADARRNRILASAIRGQIEQGNGLEAFVPVINGMDDDDNKPPSLAGVEKFFTKMKRKKTKSPTENGKDPEGSVEAV